MLIALAVCLPLVVVLHVISTLGDWSVGGIYAGAGVICVIAMLILARGLPPRPED